MRNFREINAWEKAHKLTFEIYKKMLTGFVQTLGY